MRDVIVSSPSFISVPGVQLVSLVWDIDLLVVTSVREAKGRRRTNVTRESDQSLWFLPLSAKILPQTFQDDAVAAHQLKAS